MKNIILIIVAISLFYVTQSHASEETLENVQSRGLTQEFVLTSPEGTPVASVILLAGGHGKLDLGTFFGSITFGWGEKNNLVRTREAYADQGFLVATIDAPSDRGKMNAIWRMSDVHSEDIGAVVEYLKKRAHAPVWVIGTSMGSFSAANAGVRLKESISGIVLTSSITQSRHKWKIYDEYPNGIINMNLSEVTVPVFIVSHEDDGCALTPAADLTLLVNQFSASPKVAKALFTGGDKPKSDPCKSLSAHGFLGIEQQVVDRISLFIKSN